jgi:putative PIN family toxin of toxin-antitoxin system
MQKVVIDTNVIVSALIGSSYPTQIIFNLVLGKKVIVCSSFEVFAEYVEVLHRERFSKYPQFLTKAEIVLNQIDELSLKFIPSENFMLLRINLTINFWN